MADSRDPDCRVICKGGRELTWCCGVCRRTGGSLSQGGQMNRRAAGGCEGGIDR